MRLLVVTMFAAGLLAGCGDKDGDDGIGGGTADTNTTAGADSGTDGGADDTGDTGGVLDGEGLYATHCASCHGVGGEGVDGVGPGLGGEVDRHDDEFLVDVILNGEDDMPPTAVSEGEAQAIVDWLRILFGE